MDKLEEIFELQAKLNDLVFKKQDIRGKDGSVLSTDELTAAVAREDFGSNGVVNQWLFNYLKALQEEADEVGAELLWKWWSKDTLNMQNIREEIVDVLHFLVSLALTSGMSAEDFYKLYTEKVAVNQKRQETGYSKETKKGGAQ